MSTRTHHTAKSLAAADVPAANVALMARAARHREAVFDEQEDALLDAAAELPPEQFRRLARRWQSFAETLPQRRADALVALAEGTGGARRANLDVIVDLATASGASPTDLEGCRRELVGIGPIGQATLERLACDSFVGRVVMRGKSLVVDLGRYTPVVPPAQRRALAIRDGGCVEPGCSAPPEWCDAHHGDPRTLGGPTDLDHLELRCRRHHVEVHEGRRGSRPPPWRTN